MFQKFHAHGLTTRRPQSLAFAWLLLIGLTLSLGACTYDVAPPAMPALEVPSGFTNKVNGTWALVIDNKVLTAHIDPPGFACGAFDYPIDINTSFQRSLVQVFRQVANEVVLSDHRLSAAELKARGYSGQIEFGELAFTPDVTFNQMSLTAKVDISVELDAELTVRSTSSVLLTKQLAASAVANTDAGIICQNAPQAITRAVGTAMQQLMVNSASAFGDSRDVRLMSGVWQPNAAVR
jgi:hypothetical protein